MLFVLFLILAVRGGNFAAKKWLAEGYKMPSGSMMPTLLLVATSWSRRPNESRSATSSSSGTRSIATSRI